MADDAPSIWEKVDFSVVYTTEGKPTATRTIGPPEGYWNWRRPVLDVIASLLWLYAILKVFLVDVDRELLGDLSDYRAFFFIAVAVGFAFLLRRTGTFIAGMLYVVFYPLVVLLWKVPKWLYNLRSPGAFLATGNAIAGILGNIRHSIVTFAVAAFTTLLIAVATKDVLLAVGGVIMAVLVLQAIWRTVKLSVLPSRFLRMQQRAIRWVVEDEFTRLLTRPAEELRGAEIEKFDADQQNKFLQSLSFAVISHRFISFWAHQLETYRRGPATIFFNSLAYFWLLLRVLFGLALINYALHRADTSAYEFGDPPSFLVFVRYVIAGIYGGEIDALRPLSDLASALSIATFVMGLFVAGSLLLSSALSFREARDQSEMTQTIAEIRRQEDRLDERVRQDYEVSVEEAAERLEQLRYGLIRLANFLAVKRQPGSEP